MLFGSIVLSLECPKYTAGLLLLAAGVKRLGLIEASEEKEPQLNGQPVCECGSNKGAASHIVAGCAADAQDGSERQETDIPEHSASPPVRIHLRSHSGSLSLPIAIVSN